MRRRTYLTLLSYVFGGTVMESVPSPTAQAHPAVRRLSHGVQLVNRSGTALPTFWHQRRRWVLGEYGNGYGIRITNHSPRRVEAVVTVDGRDAVNGSTGNYSRNRGYVLPPHGSVTIHGFRQSLEAVAAFRFTSPGDSYGARMGTPQNVGVIGVAFFSEAVVDGPLPRQVRPPAGRNLDASSSAGRAQTSSEGEKKTTASRQAPSRRSARAAPKQRASRMRAPREPEAPHNNLGTEYGSSEYSPVEEVPFKRARPRYPDQIHTLRYDDVEGLCARGINPFPAPPPVRRSSEPQAFPQNQFAPPP